MEQIFGCWAWDGPGERMVNVVTGERLRRVEGASRRFTDTPLAHHLLVYEADDFEFPIAVSVERLTGESVDDLVLHYDKLVSDVMIYRVDLVRSARLNPGTSSGRLAFGVWQRLAEFVPEAILFWPIAWPRVDDPCGGPGTKDHGRRVDVLGGWVNGKWSPGLIAKVALPGAHALWREARVVLRPTRFSTPAKLDAEPSSPFAMHDPRGPEEDTDAGVWPSWQDLLMYANQNGYVGQHLAQWEQRSLFFPYRIPFCVSNDGSRKLFLGRREGSSRGHSPIRGPEFCLMTPDYAAIGRMFGVRVEDSTHAARPPIGKLAFLSGEGGSPRLVFPCEAKLEEFQFSYDELDFGGIDRSRFEGMDRMTAGLRPPWSYGYYANTRSAERRVRQDLLDAISAWGRARGGIPILLESEGGVYKWAPSGDLPICPFREITLSLDLLAGVHAREEENQRSGSKPEALSTTFCFENRL